MHTFYDPSRQGEPTLSVHRTRTNENPYILTGGER